MYLRRGPYIFCDDFVKFWLLVHTNPPILYYNPFKNPDNVILRSATTQSIGGQLWHVKKKFEEQGWVFIDPESQFNPDLDEVKPISCDILKWGLLPLKHTFFKEIKHNFMEAAMDWIKV